MPVVPATEAPRQVEAPGQPGISGFLFRNHPIKGSVGFYMGVSLNAGTPKSSILIGFSMINHPFWGIPLFFETPFCYIRNLILSEISDWQQKFHAYWDVDGT